MIIRIYPTKGISDRFTVELDGDPRLTMCESRKDAESMADIYWACAIRRELEGEMKWKVQ